MSIGLLMVDCLINNCFSLKEKRSVLQSIIKRLHSNFNIAIAETNHQDLWQRSELSIVSVNTNRIIMEKNFKHILDFIEKDKRVQILNYETKAIY
jgi:uncharacterized protein YlxP (DUF503 family)